MININNGNTNEIQTGQTVVKVWRRDVADNGKVSLPRVIHEGVVIQQTSTAVRVFSNAPIAKGGDLSQEHCHELFPVKAANAWVEIIHQKDEPIEVSPAFRY